MGWLYVGSVLTRARVNVSPGWSAHITMDDTLVPENMYMYTVINLLNCILSKLKPVTVSTFLFME